MRNDRKIWKKISYLGRFRVIENELERVVLGFCRLLRGCYGCFRDGMGLVQVIGMEGRKLWKIIKQFQLGLDLQNEEMGNLEWGQEMGQMFFQIVFFFRQELRKGRRDDVNSIILDYVING